MTNHTLQKQMIQTGAALCGIAVALGAFASHTLKDRISESSFETLQTAVRYHFYHAFAILLLGAMLRKLNERYARYAFQLFLWGIIIFSGSLYILATKEFTFNDKMNFLGGLTPFGGIAFISGWFLIAYKGYNSSNGSEGNHHHHRSHHSANESEVK